MFLSFRHSRRLFGRISPARKKFFPRLGVECLEDRSLLSTGFVQANLVSDISGLAATTDSNLLNPWGLAAGPGGPWWVADNNGGVSTLYNSQGQALPLVVHIPSPTNPTGSDGTPTGIVFNSAIGAGAFQITDGTHTAPAVFLFATEDGTLVGWNPGVDPTGKFDGPNGVSTHAVIIKDNSAIPTAADGAVYKGLAIGKDSNGDPLLYATNFRSGQVEVYDAGFNKIEPSPDAFQDSKIKDGYAPFDIQNLGGKIYVTYAVQNAEKHDDVAGPAHGFVDVFSTDGVLLQRLIKHGHLNSPWGLAMAPDGFGDFAGDLLVGNFGNGLINVYDPKNGHFIAELTTSNGKPFHEDGLWALQFGNGGVAGPTTTLFFSAGLNDESDGLFGSLTPPSSGQDNGRKNEDKDLKQANTAAIGSMSNADLAHFLTQAETGRSLMGPVSTSPGISASAPVTNTVAQNIGSLRATSTQLLPITADSKTGPPAVAEIDAILPSPIHRGEDDLAARL